MSEKHEGTTRASTDSLWSELNRAAVVLNKWTQRTMYTAQTNPHPLDGTIDLEACIDKLKAATNEVRAVCDLIQ